jgi:hypothetical protein
MSGPLTAALRGMLKDARATAGQPMRRSVAGDFTLSITQSPNGMLVVELARSNQSPSIENWQHVLSQWPEAVPPDVLPRPRTEGRRHALVASWPRPVKITEVKLA